MLATTVLPCEKPSHGELILWSGTGPSNNEMELTRSALGWNRPLQLISVFGGREIVLVTSRLVIALCGVLVGSACDDVWKHYTGGVGAQSFMVADQFVILHSGFRRGHVTWVVVRNWPAASTPDQRLADGRFVLGHDGEYRVLQESGELDVPAAGVAYVFNGDHLVTFPISIREDDFVSFRTEELKAYREVEAFLRAFEVSSGHEVGARPPNNALQRVLDRIVATM